jgi:hypothetical protein
VAWADLALLEVFAVGLCPCLSEPAFFSWAGVTALALVSTAGAAATARFSSTLLRDPFHELGFASQITARRAIADEIRLPLAKLSDEDRAFIDALLARAAIAAI